MTEYKAFVIPANADEPVRVETYDDADYHSLPALIFGSGNEGFVSASTFRHRRAQLIYDDMGLFDTAPVVNPRAMQLWADFAGMTLADFTQPLVGTYAVIGLDPNTGHSADCPDDVLTYNFTWTAENR